MKKKKFDIGPYLYILPALVIIIVFRLVPIVLSFIVSFFEWTVTGTGDFIGFSNYIRIVQDREFWQSLLNTFYLVIFIVPISLILSLIFATLLNNVKKLKGFYRSVYFIPTVTSMVAISIVWKIIFNQQNGLANFFLTKIGLEPLGWLAESRGIFQLMFSKIGIDLPSSLGGPSLALFSIIIVTIWKGLGYNTIIYLAGLQNIPKVYYEAADIDGAGPFQKFYHITLPALNNTMVLVMTLSTIGGFSLFIEPFVMTGGGPMSSTLSAMLYIYNQAFYFGHMGYAATLGIFFAGIVTCI